MTFILSALNNLLPATTTYYWFLMVAFVLLQGGILAVVQKDLNLYWNLEREKVTEEFILSQ